MKRIKFLAVTILSLALLTGCETLNRIEFPQIGGDQVVASLSAATAAANLRYYYETGEVVNFLDQANLTEQEVDTIIMTLSEIDLLKSKMTIYEDNPQLIIRDLDSLKLDYLKLRSKYSVIKQVVIDNFEEYPAEARMAFLEFDEAAKEVDSKIVKMHSVAEANETVRNIVKAADLAFKVAAML